MTEKPWRFPLALPVELKDKIKDEARQKGVSANALIVDILNHYYAQPGTAEADLAYVKQHLATLEGILISKGIVEKQSLAGGVVQVTTIHSGKQDD